MRSTISSRLVPSLFGPIWAAATFIPRTSIPRTSRGIAIHLLILMRARGFGLTYTDVNVHQSALPGEAPVTSTLDPSASPGRRAPEPQGLPRSDSRDSPDLRLPVRGPP